MFTLSQGHNLPAKVLDRGLPGFLEDPYAETGMRQAGFRRLAVEAEAEAVD